MRIQDSNSIPESQQLNNKVSDVNSSAPESRPDRVGLPRDETDLTVDTVPVQDLKMRVADIPDVRQERVQQLQKAVQDGTYKVDDGQVADAMLADLSEPVEETD